MGRKKVVLNKDLENYKIYDTVGELKEIFNKADEMALEGLTPKQIWRFLNSAGVDIVTD